MSKHPRGRTAGKSFVFASAGDIAAAVRDGRTSAAAVVEEHLDRIAAVNPKLNALVYVDTAGALAAAAELDALQKTGKIKGPLHGVPISIKDTIEVAGMPCSGGTLGRKAHVPEADASVVKRLRDAGAIVLGKGNTPEFACAFETDNLAFGRTNNPYDLARTPGGSTGGDAAMIAAGGSVLAMGTDAGGSIRLPAHFCGLAALKPTMNRTPRTGAFPYPLGLRVPLSTISPIARHVRDLAQVLPIVSGPDGVDFTVPDAVLRRTDDVSASGLRIAYFINDGISAIPSEIESAVRAAADALASEGALVEEQTPSGVEETFALWSDLFGDGGAGLLTLLKNVGSSEPSPLLRRSLETIFAARLNSATDVYAALVLWDRFRLRMQAFLRDYDALLSPACAVVAPQHGTTFEEVVMKACAYTMLHNLTGWPAVVVRAGTARDGMPIGIQIAAHYWREDIALALGQIVEARVCGFEPPAV